MTYKIAILQRFLPSRSRGGVGYFTDGLAKSLAARGHQVTIFTQDPAPPGSSYQTVLLQKPSKEKWAFFFYPFQLRAIDFSGFDLILAQGDDQWIPRKNNPPIIRTLHGSAWSEALYNGLKRLSLKHFLMHLYFYFMEWIAAARSDWVVAVSEHTRKFYLKVDSVIPNGLDYSLYAHPAAPKAPHPVILFVGELTSRKRGELLKNLFLKEIISQIPNAELWMVTPKTDETNESGIRYFHQVSQSELVKLYQQAWVFCLPSAYEGFGRPYAEALAAGTAVVSTPNPGANEILENGKFGLIVKPSELSSSIVQILKDANKRHSFESRGFERARIFDWDAVVKQYESLFERVNQGKQPRS